MKFISASVSLLLLTGLAACGGSKSGGSSQNGQSLATLETVANDGSNVSGKYYADLYPMNYNLTEPTIGKATFSREGDEFKAEVNLTKGPLGTEITQAIYTGVRCPAFPSDDTNHDSYIDIQEARAAVGSMIIPLDANLDGQYAGLGNMPYTEGESGSYTYQQSASFQRLFADLRASDDNSGDHIVKVGENEGLGILGRVVLLQGLTTTVSLPGSIGADDGKTTHESLPIGCGIIFRDFGDTTTPTPEI